MSEIKDGGPAFPHDDRAQAYGRAGMDLRDYFAAKAMQGMCAHQDTWGLVIDEIADHAYMIADAMLRARGQS